MWILFNEFKENLLKRKLYFLILSEILNWNSYEIVVSRRTWMLNFIKKLFLSTGFKLCIFIVKLYNKYRNLIPLGGLKTSLTQLEIICLSHIRSSCCGLDCCNGYRTDNKSDIIITNISTSWAVWMTFVTALWYWTAKYARILDPRIHFEHLSIILIKICTLAVRWGLKKLRNISISSLISVRVKL